MTGSKPDERLRTPMQWSAGAGVGFTSGTPWEPAQPDAARSNVAAQQGDPLSLLNLYRRLIHLRRDNAALAGGRLVPLTSSNPSVTAYLRRDGAHAVLVVANLSGAVVSGLTIGSGAGALPAGIYQPHNLLGGPDGPRLEVGPDGRIQSWAPGSGNLEARASLILDLIRP